MRVRGVWASPGLVASVQGQGLLHWREPGVSGAGGTPVVQEGGQQQARRPGMETGGAWRAGGPAGPLRGACQPFLCRCFCPLCPLSDTCMALLEELGSKGDEGVLLRQDCVFAGQTPVSLEGAPGMSFHPAGSVVSVTALKGNCHMSLWKVCWKSQWCWRPPRFQFDE